MAAVSRRIVGVLALTAPWSAMAATGAPAAMSYAQVFAPNSLPSSPPASSTPVASDPDVAPLTRPLTAYVVRMGQPPKLVCDASDGGGGDGAAPPEVQRSEPVRRAFDAFRRKDYEASVAAVAPAAQKGYLAAAYALACVMDGLEHTHLTRGPWTADDAEGRSIDSIRRALFAARAVRPGLSSGLDWMKWAAGAGYEPAQLELAGRIDSPRTRRWGEASVEWVARLADARRPAAVRQLAFLYLDGQGKPVDPETAARLFRRAAAAGDAEAMWALVRLLRNGTVSLLGKQESLRWLRQLVAGGDKEARYYLALAMRETGGQRDLAVAVALLKEAAADGDAAAAYELATWYRLGIGVTPEPDRERNLVARAANGGDCRAKIEEAEQEIASEGQDLTADRKKILESGIGSCTPVWRRSETDDWASGFTLSRAERARWEARRHAAREVLGTVYFDGQLLKAALLSGDQKAEDAAIASLVAMASDADHGLSVDQALVTLAYPAPWLPLGVTERFNSVRWRARIDELDRERRDRVRTAILSTPLSDQNFSAALQASAEAGTEQALLHRFSTLNAMGLQAVAFRELFSYLPRAKTNEIRDTLLRSTVACDWNQVASDWIARAGWEADGCSGVHALKSLDADQLERLSALGSDSAKLFLALDRLEGRSGPKDALAARTLLESLDPKYEEGEIAQAIIGTLAEDGVGSPPDLGSAAAHYQAGIARFDENVDQVWFPGNPSAATRLGLLLLEGRGVERNVSRALELIRYGAYNAVASADTAFADSLWLGLGQPRDRVEALRWYREAASHGDPVAFVRFGLLARLGLWNERGLGASRWYALAARADDKAAYLELARAATLAPMTQDPAAEVRDWLRRAAAKGSGWASLWLSACEKDASVGCFRRQPDFDRLSARIAGAAPPGAAGRNGFGFASRSAAQRLQLDVDRLGARAEYLLKYTKELSVLVDTLEELERVQLYHGDASGAIGTRVRRLIVKDSVLAADNGSLGNYFSLVESSCHWGEASKLAYQNGRSDAALFFAKVAVNRLQEARRYLSDLEGDLRECFIKVHEDRYRWLAGLFIENGRLAEAETVLGMLKDFEHAQYTGDQRRRRSSTERINYSRGEASALAALDKASASLSKTYSAEEREAAPGGSAGSSLRHELDALIKEVALLDADKPPSIAPSRVDWLASIQRSIVRDLRDGFTADTVALHAVVLPDRIHWIISTADGQQSLTIPVSQSTLSARISDYLASIHTRSPNVAAKAQELYRLVFEPVDVELRRRNVKNLLLSLDDRLRYLPFAALHDGKGWLVERYSMSNFRRPSDYLRNGKGGAWKVAAFGASRGGSGLDPLPGVVRELDQIVRTDEHDMSGIVPGMVDLDDAFTRVALANALKRDFRVIHIASHFMLDQDHAADSFLLLGDGTKLPLLDFSADGALTFSHADLVMLSACQTALHSARGNGSEIDSMGTVAQDAGAPAVVASLWSVADEPTASLMLRFYRHRVQEGFSTATALREAQIEMIRGTNTDGPATPALNRRNLDHPYYWAPFIILGNAR